MAPELDILTRNPVTRNSDVADLGKSPRRSGAGTAGLRAGIPWAGGWGTRRGPCCGIGASAETSGSEGGDTPEASPMRPQRTVPKAGRSRQPEASTVRLAAEPRAPGKHPWLPPEPSPRLSHTAWPHSWSPPREQHGHAEARMRTPAASPRRCRRGSRRQCGRAALGLGRRGGGAGARHGTEADPRGRALCQPVCSPVAGPRRWRPGFWELGGRGGRPERAHAGVLGGDASSV